jgi:hypothetical protein
MLPQVFRDHHHSPRPEPISIREPVKKTGEEGLKMMKWRCD